MQPVFIILPSQLFARPSSFWNQWSQIWLIEDSFYINKHMHPLKLWLHKASMLEYFNYIPSKQKKYITANEAFALPSKFSMFHPTDEDMIRKYRRASFLDSPAFILSISELEVFDTPIMNVFYKRMRVKLNILMTKDNHPKNGKWSFDINNRKKYPTDYVDNNLLDREYKNKYITQAKPITSKSNINIQIDHMPYPTNRNDALRALRKFINERLPTFGPYQDAMRKDVLVGQHSCISASLNIGIITPLDVINAISTSTAPIASVEGFIRQIIGWREYIRLKYVLYGLQPWNYLHNMNSPLPKSWYSANTGIETLDWSISRVLKYAYAPHIERLMLLLNYAMLMRLKYKDVRKWFIRCFIDAIGEWQMINVEMGINSLAPANRFMTRAYITNSNYLKLQGLKISNQDQEQLQMLYKQFIIDNKELCKHDYQLAAQVKRL